MSTKVGILIQARMSSRRVPAKVLREIAGKPMLAYVVERCKAASGADLVAIITSDEVSDDPVAAFAAENDVVLYRGSLDDVAGRFLAAANTFGLDAFGRVTGDSPLIDQRLISRAIALFRQEGADLVTNVLRRTFPIGMSIEIMDRARFAEAYDAMTESDEREHATRFYHRHPELFRIVSFENDKDLADRTLSVDHEADIARIEKIITALEGDHRQYDCAEICAVAERVGALTEWAP